MTFKLGNQAKTWGSAALFFLVTTVLCGVIYTAACTGLAQLFFPHQANGSIIEVDGTKYGSELVGQRFTDEKHLWGRAMNPARARSPMPRETTCCGTPRPISACGRRVRDGGAGSRRADPRGSSRDGEQAHPQRPRDELRQRVRSAHLAAAAEYQVDRLARTTGKSASEIRDIIKQCTEQPQFGFLGDARVNVLKVNLMLDGVL